MKAKITFEKFNNGISLKWSSENFDNENIVALDFDAEKAIGKMILDDINMVMDRTSQDVVTLNIEYQTEKP